MGATWLTNTFSLGLNTSTDWAHQKHDFVELTNTISFHFLFSNLIYIFTYLLSIAFDLVTFTVSLYFTYSDSKIGEETEKSFSLDTTAIK